MPLISYPEDRPALGTFSALDVRVPEADVEDPGVWAELGAAWRQDNTIVSASTNKMAGIDPAAREDGVTGESVWSEIQGTDYEEHWERFAQVHNRRAVSALKAQIDMESEDRRTLAAGGWSAVPLQLGAAFFDLPTLLPGGALVRSVQGGVRVGRTALTTAGAGALGAGVSEIALQSTQETRPLAESALAVGGGAILGGLLGGTVGALYSKADRIAALRAVENARQVRSSADTVSEFRAGLVEGQSAGAAAVDGPVLDDYDIAAGAKGIGAATARLNPLLRAVHSPSAVHRSIMADLAETGFYLERNVRGEGNLAVESAVKYWDRGALSKGLTEMRSIYSEARKSGLDMTGEEFRSAVSQAMRRADQGDNAAVTKAARAWREALFDPLKEQAIDVGLLPPDVSVKTAASYLTRIWSSPKLTAGEARFKSIVHPWLSDQLQQLEFKAEEIRIGNRIIDADKARETFDRLDGKFEGIEDQLADRQAMRGRRTAFLDEQRRARQSVLTERAPKPLVDLLRGADENAAMIDAVRQARAAARSAGAKKPFAQRQPVIAMIRKKGGVRIGSQLDSELRAMDVTPQTHPGLFRKDGGLGDIDNFVKDEDDIFADLPDDGAGYVDPRALYEAIRSELGGLPLKSPADIEADAVMEDIDRIASEWLSKVGLSENATVKDVRDFIAGVLGAERNTQGLDSRIARLEMELERFDMATDRLSNERTIAASEARVAREAMDALEAELDQVAGIANASPRVSLVVDLANTKRSLFRAKLKERSLSKRVEAIQRLRNEGQANDEILAELAAKEIELGRLRSDIDGLKAKADRLDPMQPKVKQEIPEFVSDADRVDYVDGIVDEIFNQLTGRARQGMPSYDMVMTARGPLKERTFNIPDELVEEFLENDIELIARRYARVMAADVELTRMDKRLGGPGKPDLKGQLERIVADYQRLRDEVLASTDLDTAAKEKALAELRVREKSDAEDLGGVRDVLRGQYKLDSQHTNFSRVLAAAQSFNYMRSLGGVLVSSLADAVRPAMVHGMRRYMGEGIAPLMRNLKGVKMAVADAKLAGAVTERVLQSRIATMAELADPYAQNSPFERMLQNMANAFSKATLLPFWNDMHKSIASVLIQNRILSNAVASAGNDLPRPTPVLQPAAFHAQPTATIDDLYAVAGKWQADLESAGADIAKATGAEFKSRGIKDKATSAEKISRKGYKDASQLTDVVRGGFTVATPQQADDIIARLAARYDVLDEGWTVQKSGYFDRKALIRFEDGTIGEVQFWEPNLRKAKSGGGHDLYKKSRSMPYGSPEHAALLAEEQELYSAAMAAAGEAWSGSGGFKSSKPQTRILSRQAASSNTPPVWYTSFASTSTQGPPGSSWANAEDFPSTAGRRSQSMKSISNTSGNSIAQQPVAGYAGLGADERRYMGFLGIDEDMSRRIAQQFREFGQVDGTVHVPGLERWTDEGARRAFAAALNKDVDGVIVTKGAADVPLFAHTPAGRALLQFRTFALASHQRVLMRGMQESQRRFFQGVVGMMAFGMAAYWFKSVESGRTEEGSWWKPENDNVGTWMAEGLDRSGLFSIAFEINNTWEKIGGPGFFSLASLAGQQINPDADARQPASRYTNRNAFGAMLGPSFQLGTDAAQLLGIPAQALDGALKGEMVDVTPGDVNRATSMVPFYTLPYWRWFMEGGFGLKDSQTFRGVEPELKALVE